MVVSLSLEHSLFSRRQEFWQGLPYLYTGNFRSNHLFEMTSLNFSLRGASPRIVPLGRLVSHRPLLF